MRAWIRRPRTSIRRLVSGEPPCVCGSPAAARREEADDRAIVTEDQQAPAAASSQTDDAGSGVRALSIPFVRTFPVLADEIRPLGLLADRPRRSVRGKRPMFTDDLADSAIHVAVAVHRQDLLLDPLAQPPRPHFDARVVLPALAGRLLIQPPSVTVLLSLPLSTIPDPVQTRACATMCTHDGKEKPVVSRGFLSGAYRDRTGDLRLAKPALSQLS